MEGKHGHDLLKVCPRNGCKVNMMEKETHKVRHVQGELGEKQFRSALKCVETANQRCMK